MRALLLTSLLANCSFSNRAGIVLAEAGIACDWAQTRHAAAGGWRETREANPVLGEHPSTARVDAYMVGAAAVLAAAWRLLPERARPALWVVAVAAQANAIAGNVGTTGTLCGVD